MDKPAGHPGFWVPFDTGLALLDATADPDGDGVSNLTERAFLTDPMMADAPDTLTMVPREDGSSALSFQCAAGVHTPRICLRSPNDLETWWIESSCQVGGSFEPPISGAITESPWQTGRRVVVDTVPGSRRFWRLIVKP